MAFIETIDTIPVGSALQQTLQTTNRALQQMQQMQQQKNDTIAQLAQMNAQIVQRAFGLPAPTYVEIPQTVITCGYRNDARKRF